jgi:2-keto-myo-inositol isomerase
VLVDGADRLENIAQIKALLDAGYDGPFSFEPFAEEVHALADGQTALAESIGFIKAKL